MDNVNTAAGARKALTDLFDSVKGQTLFGKNDYPVDKQGTLAFIKAYKKAIRLEEKPLLANSEAQKKKKLERLAALEEIECFVNGLRKNDYQTPEHCRLALQLCGRVRERSLVHQYKIGYCGGFAVLQAAWGRNPLKMTKLTIALAEKGQADVETMVKGRTKRLEVPIAFKWDKYHEALADSLLISTRYDLGSSGSCVEQDAMNATFLGVPVKVYSGKSVKKANGKDDYDADQQLLSDLCQASKQKCTVRAAVDGHMASFLEEKLTKDFTRKKKGAVRDIDADFKAFRPKPGSDTGHAVIIDKFELKKNNNQQIVECKLHTWGVMHHIRMSVKTFMDHFDHKGCFIAGASEEDSFPSFKEIGDEVHYDRNKTTGVLVHKDGREKLVPIGGSASSFDSNVKKQYEYLGYGGWKIRTTRT